MIKTESLVLRFSEGAALRYADLRFLDERSYAVLGPSGCGKSTLLNMIAGIITPTEGIVSIDGNPVSAWPQRKKDDFRIRSIGYVYQDFKLIEEMRVQDNIDILKLEGVDTSGTQALLEKLGLKGMHRRRVRTLSGGEKQRVAIARALVKRPPIVLADEPTGNLNYATGRDVMRQLIDNAGSGTLIAVTHDDRLADLFDEVLDMTEIAHFEGAVEEARHA